MLGFVMFQGNKFFTIKFVGVLDFEEGCRVGDSALKEFTLAV